MFTQSIPLVYSAVYSFSDSATGIVQLSIFLGQTVGLGLCLGADWYYLRKASPWRMMGDWVRSCGCGGGDGDGDGDGGGRKGLKRPDPEKRLHLSIPLTLVGLGGGFLLYAWPSAPALSTPPSPPTVPFISPTLGLFLVGLASMSIVTAVDLYITDAYASYASSAIAAVTFGENLISATLPLATNKLYEDLGPRWAGTLLAGLGAGLVGAPVLLVWKGGKIRGKSRFMRAREEGEGEGEGQGEGGGEGSSGRSGSGNENGSAKSDDPKTGTKPAKQPSPNLSGETIKESRSEGKEQQAEELV